MPIGSHRSEAIQDHSQLFQHAAIPLPFFEFHYVMSMPNGKANDLWLNVRSVENPATHLPSPLMVSLIYAPGFGPVTPFTTRFAASATSSTTSIPLPAGDAGFSLRKFDGVAFS